MNEKDYIEINKASYDIVAKEYKSKYKNNVGANKFYDLLQKFVTSKKKNEISKMLEIGPGVGTLLKIFRNLGLSISVEQMH